MGWARHSEHAKVHTVFVVGLEPKTCCWSWEEEFLHKVIKLVLLWQGVGRYGHSPTYTNGPVKLTGF